MSKRITMIGSANIDFIMSLPHLPRKGESVTASSYMQTFGGKGANQAVAAKRSGADVNLIVSLGGDSLGKTLLEKYTGEGFNVDNVAVHNSTSCGTALIFFEPDGDNMLGYTMGANALLSEEQVARAEPAIASSALIMMQNEIPDAPMAKAIQLAQKNGVEVMLNFAPHRESELDLGDIDILVVNETEAAALLGSGEMIDEESAFDAALELAARGGHRLTIITLGANGSIVCEKGEASHIPAFKIDPKDATAAGDTYCGALATALMENMSTAKSALFASAAGALCAARIGAQPSIPSRKEIDAFLNEPEAEPNY